MHILQNWYVVKLMVSTIIVNASNSLLLVVRKIILSQNILSQNWKTGPELLLRSHFRH